MKTLTLLILISLSLPFYYSCKGEYPNKAIRNQGGGYNVEPPTLGTQTPTQLPVPIPEGALKTIGAGQWMDPELSSGLFGIEINEDGFLQLKKVDSVNKYIWVANNSKGKVVKVDPANGQVLLNVFTTAAAGDYKIYNTQKESNPSRTAIDLDGNVWVVNRAAPQSVTKLNSVTGEIIQVWNLGTKTGGTGGGVAVDLKNNIWVGTYDGGFGGRLFRIKWDGIKNKHVLDVANCLGKDCWDTPGNIPLYGIAFSGKHGGYEAQGFGRVWYTSLHYGKIGFFDTQTQKWNSISGDTLIEPVTKDICGPYGLAVDSYENVWIACRWYKKKDNNEMIVFNPKGVLRAWVENGSIKTEFFDTGFAFPDSPPNNFSHPGRGVGVDKDGCIWVSSTDAGPSKSCKVNILNESGKNEVWDIACGGVVKFTRDGSVYKRSGPYYLHQKDFVIGGQSVKLGAQPLGVGPDLDNNLWIVDQDGALTKMDKNGNVLDVFNVGREFIFEPQRVTYTYSDFTGSQLHALANKSGGYKVVVVLDEMVDFLNKGIMDLDYENVDEMNDSSRIEVSYKCGKTKSEMDAAAWSSVLRGKTITFVCGQTKYMSLDIRFSTITPAFNPTLKRVSILKPN